MRTDRPIVHIRLPPCQVVPYSSARVTKTMPLGNVLRGGFAHPASSIDEEVVGETRRLLVDE
jgi:hypothetical protein